MKIDDILKEIFNLRTNRIRENIDDLKLIYELLGSPCKNCKIISQEQTEKVPQLLLLKIYFFQPAIMSVNLHRLTF